jgi:neutral amino acid transport system permease protein
MDVPQLLFNGLALGSIIALAAVGLTLTYGILRLSNFAHGDFLTLGAYLTWLVNGWGVNLWLAMLLGAGGTVFMMLLSEQLLWKPLRDRRASSTSLIIVSIGLALFLRNGILFLWGGDNQRYNLPVLSALDIGGVKVASDRLLVLVITFFVFLILHFLLQRTKIGKAMRAVSDNLDLARVSGIDVERVVFWTWVITGILAAFAGAMFGLIVGGIRPNMGWFLILSLFASVILGGIGNPYGAISGALVIGITQELSVPWLGSDYKVGIALLLMILILFIRPQGLFKGTM